MRSNVKKIKKGRQTTTVIVTKPFSKQNPTHDIRHKDRILTRH